MKTNGFLQEFKLFVMRGNVADMAVGIIIGAAFGKIVSSLVADIIMPPIGLLLGGMEFTSLKIILQEADPVRQITEVAITYGIFIQTLIDFIIIAFAIFMIIKFINKLTPKKAEEAAPETPAEPSEEVKLLGEIRDLLSNK